jgi:cell fate (sporulation/competence/biofilm development) regulator YlbF (YheA/YmcA/DUF963 family)
MEKEQKHKDRILLYLDAETREFLDKNKELLTKRASLSSLFKQAIYTEATKVKELHKALKALPSVDEIQEQFRFLPEGRDVEELQEAFGGLPSSDELEEQFSNLPDVRGIEELGEALNMLPDAEQLEKDFVHLPDVKSIEELNEELNETIIRLERIAELKVAAR